MTGRQLIRVGILLGAVMTPARAGDSPLTLWFAKPAAFSREHWNGPPFWQSVINEALPIGNGRIGALIQGVPENELLRLNEDSLWSGNDTQEGDYQALADVSIALMGSENATDYRRDLDLTQALAHVTYYANRIHYQREYFASHPANVLVVHLTADKPGSLSGTISLRDARQTATVSSPQLLTLAGKLTDNGLHYETQVMVLNEKGTQKVSGEKIDFDNCDALTLIIGAGTNYLPDPEKNIGVLYPTRKSPTKCRWRLKIAMMRLKRRTCRTTKLCFNAARWISGLRRWSKLRFRPTSARDSPAKSMIQELSN